MYLSAQEKDAVGILKDARDPRNARDRMLDYFNRDEAEMFSCIRSLGAKGFLSYVDVNVAGQRNGASPKITGINYTRCSEV